jgi:Fic family protein
MEHMMTWYQTEAISLHPVERGAMLHAIFVGIHPFIDGNGRTARLILNLELMKEGLPPVIIKVANRLEYYDALDKAHTSKDYSDFIQLVTAKVENSLDLYLSVIS